MMVFSFFLFLISGPWIGTGTEVFQSTGCRKETIVVEGRPLDVHRCEGFSVSLRSYVVTISNCLPGLPSCLGQGIPPMGAGEWAHVAMSRTGPVEIRAHLAYFPFSHCLPDIPQPVLRDPYLSGENLFIPLELQRKDLGLNRRMVATGLGTSAEPPAECYVFHGVNIQAASEGGSEISRQAQALMDFIVRTVRVVRRDVPVRRITAAYGYSEGYWGGYRFHEGLDTSWNIRRGPPPDVPLSELQAIWTPVPLMPVIVMPGWGMGIMPCTLARDGERLRRALGMPPDGGAALLDAILELERGTSPEFDCALMFGGVHLFTRARYTVPYRAALLLHRPNGSCRGKLPLECSLDLYVPAGGFFMPCALERGYGGDFAPHCHYQAVALSGDQAREILRILRESPGRLIRPPAILDHLREDWGGIYRTYIYSKSFDPMLILFPELVWEGIPDEITAMDEVLRRTRVLPLPDVVAPYSNPVVRFVGWYTRSPEDYPGMPDGDLRHLEYLGAGQPCRIRNKTMPGELCRPSVTYYNADEPYGDSDPVFRTTRLKHVLLNSFRVIRVFRSVNPTN